VPSSWLNSFPLLLHPVLLPSVLLGMTVGLLPMCAYTQELRGVEVQGYTTVAHPSSGFDVNGEHVATSPATRYKLMGGKMNLIDIPARLPQVGDYVWVVGSFDGQTGIAKAKTLIFRNDLNERLTGFAVIEKLIPGGAETVFEADGYHVRIVATTETSFRGDLKGIADVGANTWVRYTGKRDKSGVLLATKATFVPGKLKATKDDVVGLGREQMRFEAPDLANKRDGRVNLEMFGGWRTVPADRELQERIGRVGMSVVPDYQKAMAEGDPHKIQFRFYGIYDEGLRAEFCSSQSGLILIPRQAVERLKNDSQLAAVLADGVAFTLQHQATRLSADVRIWLGEAAGDAALAAMSPWLAIDAAFGEVLTGAHPNTKDQILAREQRERIALALMADAGYDPWQAPEAWRLLGPKRLPSDLNSLKYPDFSGYQLSILSLQYSGIHTAGATEAAQHSGEPVGQQ